MQVYLEKLYSIFLESSGVSIDSRENVVNKIFFSLSGRNSDGNQFALGALEKGALLSVVTDAALKGHPGCLLVDNAEEALQALAALYRKQFAFPVIAITGSNGKTTTKELLISVLSEQYKVAGTKGNLNNHLGVPITLLSTPLDSEVLILEMGANAPGDISFLCDIAQPDWGLLTSIGQAHLEGFGSLKGVIEAKFKLFESVDAQGGICFVNANDPAILNTRISREGDVRVQSGKVTGREEIIVAESHRPFVCGYVASQQKRLPFASHVTGHHNWLNIQNVFAVSLYLGISLESFVRGLERYFPDNSRSQWMSYGNSLLLMDAYNANPSSVQAMLKDFLGIESSRAKVALIGGMGELGEQSLSHHLDLVDSLDRADGLSRYLLIGPQFKDCQPGPKGSFYEDWQRVPETVLEDFSKNPALILVKGSRSIALERLFMGDLIKPFDQSEHKI
jgi:UDP-N-acetylmuramoyl-tripeptide--D-alanyl-D-alanine ligase